MNEIEGYRQPLHTSLTLPHLIAGVPRQFLVLNCGFAAIEFIIFKSLYIIPVHLLLHYICSIIARKDPRIFTILWRRILIGGYYTS